LSVIGTAIMFRWASSRLITRQVVRRGTEKTGDVLSH
jgi:hypothetical protein